MNKFQLFNRIKEEVEKKRYKTKVLLNESKSNPLLKISKENNKTYVAICEAGIKVAKYPKIVFCGISPKIQSLIEMEKTFVVIIDYKPSKQKFILTKLDSTNYRRNKINYLIFHFKRPEYGNFYNTESLPALFKEIQKTVN